MSRVKIPKITYTYVNAPDSQERVKRAYYRIVTDALKRLAADQRKAVEIIRQELETATANKVQ